MSDVKLLDATRRDDGTVEIVFGTTDGVRILVGTVEEVTVLSERMAEASKLATLIAVTNDVAWLPSTIVGKDAVAFGIGGPHVRVRITDTATEAA